MLKRCRKAFEEYVERHPTTVSEKGGKEAWLANDSEYWYYFRQGWRHAITEMHKGASASDLEK